MKALARFFSEAAFPAFMMAVLAVWQAILAVLVFLPGTAGRWGGLAADFRIRCFDYDPASGAMDWTAAWIMLSQPPVLALILGFVWWAPLAGAWRLSRPKLFLSSGAGLLSALLAGGALYAGFAPPGPGGDEAFPGERIRTALPMPDFALLNQRGQEISGRYFRGRVVLLTAVYTTCGESCPTLLMRAKGTLEKLPGEMGDEVVLAAVSLDPENDTVEMASWMAESYGLEAPGFHFLTGDPVEVNRVLDRLEIARVRDEKSGRIDHANLFFLIDRRGKIAYRLGLSDRHEPWLVEGLLSLLREE